jgi:hypothetical protein
VCYFDGIHNLHASVKTYFNCITPNTIHYNLLLLDFCTNGKTINILINVSDIFKQYIIWSQRNTFLSSFSSSTKSAIDTKFTLSKFNRFSQFFQKRIQDLHEDECHQNIHQRRRCYMVFHAFDVIWHLTHSILYDVEHIRCYLTFHTFNVIFLLKHSMFSAIKTSNFKHNSVI